MLVISVSVKLGSGSSLNFNYYRHIHGYYGESRTVRSQTLESIPV